MFSTRKAVLIKLPLFILCTICLAALVVFFLVHRSFSRAALKTGLEEAISGQAEIGAFHSRYFPPGCVAEGVSLRQGPPLIVVSKLSIRSTLAGLISGRRVSIRADGMRVLVPATGSREPIKLSSHSNIRIIEFGAENAVLEIGRSDKQPLRFLVHELKLGNMGTGSRLLFNVRLTNPEPPGEISASGEFGPWNARDFGRTPLVGEYLFQGADLGVFRGIRGQLSSHGRFQGVLERIGVEGDTDTPDFQVKSSTHAVDLLSRFQALVDANNGDTQFAGSGVTFLEYERAISGQCGPKNRPEGERSRHPDGFECRENSGSSSFIHQITARTHVWGGQLSRHRHNSAGQVSVPEESHVDGRFWN